MSTIKLVQSEEEVKWLSPPDKKKIVKQDFFALIEPLMGADQGISQLKGLMPVNRDYQTSKDKVHASLSMRNIAQIDFSPIQQEEKGPHPMLHVNDFVRSFGTGALQWAPDAIKAMAQLPLKGLPYVALATKNADSDHVVRDTAIDVGAARLTIGLLSSGIGSANIAGLAILVGHVAQQAKAHSPGPSKEELGQLATSLEQVDRRYAHEWIQVKAGLQVLSLPADALHAVGDAVKSAFNAPSWQVPTMEELGNMAISEDPNEREFAQEWLRVKAGLKILSLGQNN